jgi:hypothetical protein
MSDTLTMTRDQMDRMLAAQSSVSEERERQHARWGVQRHTWPEWLCILTEEVGEAAERANRLYWGQDEDAGALRAELVQVAAVAVAMIEQIDEQREDEA